MSAIGGNGPTIGTVTDIVNRLRATLAPWFPDPANAPVLTSVLTSQADAFAFVYQYLQFAANQTRIKTATGGWLDLIAWDYFGARFTRRINETDASFASRLLKELLRPRQTRAAVTQLIVDLVGTPPQIQEAWNPQDWGCYGNPAGGCGYGMAIGYGSLQYPNQVFVTTLTVPGSGIPGVAGYGSYLGGYGGRGSSSEYGDLSQITGALTNTELYADISQVIAAGIIAWVSIVGQFKPVPVSQLAGQPPPWSVLGRSAAFETILSAWVPPDPTPFEGALQYAAPRRLLPTVLAVPVNNPAPNRDQLDNLVATLATWWLPAAIDPAFFVFEGRLQPFEPRKLPPAFMAVPVNNPPQHAGQAAITAAIVNAAWTPPDPTPFGRQPYEPRKLPGILLNNTQPRVAEQNAITAAIVAQTWAPPDASPHLPQSRFGA